MLFAHCFLYTIIHNNFVSKIFVQFACKIISLIRIAPYTIYSKLQVNNSCIEIFVIWARPIMAYINYILYYRQSSATQVAALYTFMQLVWKGCPWRKIQVNSIRWNGNRAITTNRGVDLRFEWIVWTYHWNPPWQIGWWAWPENHKSHLFQLN